MRGVIGLVTLLAFAGVTQTSAAQSPPPTPVLSSVSCPSVAWCVAVGYHVNQSDGTRSLAVVERWNGKRWALQSTPTPLGGWLDGVSCTSKNACTAVGATGTLSQGNLTPLAERWNGRHWVIQPTSSLGQQGWLDAVSCSSQNACTAVGESVAPTYVSTVIGEGWNGKQWVLEPTRFPSGGNLGIPSAVSCASNRACMMVGISEQGSDSAIAGIWNGTEWEIQRLLTRPTYKDSPIYLDGVSCKSRGGCVAVGSYQPDANRDATVALRWNVATGSVLLPPPLAESPRAVSCTSTSSCTAVGDRLNTSIGKAVAEHFNGRKWVNQPLPPLRSAVLEAVWCRSTNACTAVGQTNTGALIERWNGRRWVLQHSPT